MSPDAFSPFKVAAILVDGNKVEILDGAGIIERAHRLIHVLEAPAIVPLMSREVARNPSLSGLGLLAISSEGPLSNRPEDA